MSGSAEKNKGYVQIYTGDGKGKTTAALGLALRAAGYGYKTHIGQFMKGQSYGELIALRDHPLIRVQQYGDERCLFKHEVKEEHRRQARAGLAHSRACMLGGEYRIVILDEINVALWFDLVPVQDVLTVINLRPEPVELILTGRRAPEKLIQAADLVTEMKEIRHYYQKGVPARDGIER